MKCSQVETLYKHAGNPVSYVAGYVLMLYMNSFSFIFIAIAAHNESTVYFFLIKWKYIPQKQKSKPTATADTVIYHLTFQIPISIYAS